jgi:hypothetical protein
MLTKNQKTLSRIERKYGVEFILKLYSDFNSALYNTDVFSNSRAFKDEIAQVYNETSTDWKNFLTNQKAELL